MHMSQANRTCDQMGKQGRARMGLKKLRIEGKKLGMKKFFDAWQINFCVLGPGMIPVDKQACQCQE